MDPVHNGDPQTGGQCFRVTHLFIHLFVSFFTCIYFSASQVNRKHYLLKKSLIINDNFEIQDKANDCIRIILNYFCGNNSKEILHV